MAEIRIQEKRRPVWPWILLILILIAAAILIYFYLNRHKDNDNNPAVPSDTTSYYQGDTINREGAQNQVVPADNIDQFQQYVESDSAGTFNKEYISNGLNLMAGAVHDIVSRGDSVKSKLNTRVDSLTSYTQNVTDTSSAGFSRQVGKSFSAAFDVISGLQQERFPDLKDEVRQLQLALKNFSASKAIEAQEKPVRDFLRMSASIISNMKNTARAI